MFFLDLLNINYETGMNGINQYCQLINTVNSPSRRGLAKVVNTATTSVCTSIFIKRTFRDWRHDDGMLFFNL